MSRSQTHAPALMVHIHASSSSWKCFNYYNTLHADTPYIHVIYWRNDYAIEQRTKCMTVLFNVLEAQYFRNHSTERLFEKHSRGKTVHAMHGSKYMIFFHWKHVLRDSYTL